MSSAGDFYDNAVAESFFASVKKKSLSRKHSATCTEATMPSPNTSTTSTTPSTHPGRHGDYV